MSGCVLEEKLAQVLPNYLLIRNKTMSSSELDEPITSEEKVGD